MQRLLAILMTIALILGAAIPATALTYEEYLDEIWGDYEEGKIFDRALRNILDEQDGNLYPGDLLASGARSGSVQKLNTNNYDYYSPQLYCSLINPGCASILLEEYVIIGDLYEFNDNAAMLYEDGTVIPGIHEVFKDGERMTLFHDPAKHEMVKERFISWNAVCDSEATEAAVVMFTNNRMGMSHHVDMEDPQNIAWFSMSHHKKSRPASEASVWDIFGEPNDDGYLNTDPDKAPINPYMPQPELPPISEFSDVTAAHWAHKHIMACREKGLMQGVGDDMFQPEAVLTKAQVAQIAYNAYGGDLNGAQLVNMTDVASTDWSYKAVEWLVKNDLAELSEGEVDALGLILNEGEFHPNEPATRWFIADILYQIAEQKGVTLPQTRPATSFPDLKGDYEAYIPAISALQGAGIISGFPDGSFGPAEGLTRCQMAKLIDAFTEQDGLAP